MQYSYFRYFARKSNTTFMLAASVNCAPPCPAPCNKRVGHLVRADSGLQRIVEQLALLRRHVAVGGAVLDQERRRFGARRR